jgi:hypothetical protein
VRSLTVSYQQIVEAIRHENARNEEQLDQSTQLDEKIPQELPLDVSVDAPKEANVTTKAEEFDPFAFYLICVVVIMFFLYHL